MNWEAVGAVGEVVGAAAVLATLVFLALQIREGQRAQRESNTLARSAAADRSFEQFSGFRRLIAGDPDVTRIWLAGCAGEALGATDEERFQQLATDYLFIFAMWIQRTQAVKMPGLAESATHFLVAELRERPGLRPHWSRVGEVGASSSTRAAVSSALST
jgi:hypothetical protein